MIDRLEVELFGQPAGELRISGPLRSPEHWAAFPDAAGYRKAYVLDRVQSLATAMLDALAGVGAGIVDQGGDEARMRRVMDAIADNIQGRR